MPATAIRRRLRNATPTRQGKWLDLGHDATPPDSAGVLKAFGPPRKVAGKIRLVKDLLPVGQWDIGDGEMWDVTPTTLQAIADSYAQGQAAGYAANLTKSHGDERMAIHPDDLVSPIDAVRVIGSTLWFSVYVSSEEAAYLMNPSRKVSIGTLEPFQDGAGNHYAIQLIHAAVCDQPVVVGQGPFIKLSLTPGARLRDRVRRRLSKGQTVMPTPTKPAAPKRLDDATIARRLQAAGIKPAFNSTQRKLAVAGSSAGPSPVDIRDVLQRILDVVGADVKVPEFSANWWDELQRFTDTLEGVLGEEDAAAPAPMPPAMSVDSQGVPIGLSRKPSRAKAIRLANARNDAAFAKKLSAAGIKPAWNRTVAAAK